MKKITILSIMLAFVFSASAQFIQAPKGHMTKVSETHLKTLPLNQLKQNKSVFEGWIFPADLGTNLNGGDGSFYDTYSQPISADSTVVTASSDGTNYVWMHSIGYVFDARSLALDENLAEAPVAGSYNVDSLVLYAWYELRNNKYDTLLIEIGAVNEDDANSLSALALPGDTALTALKTTNNATQQFGLGTVWSNPNKTTFKYTLTQNDTTFAYAKEIIIPLPSDITVGMGQVLGVNITFIPGTQYASGDTLIIYGEDATTPNKLNSFLFYYMSAKDAFGAAFYDPFGNNAFNYNHTYSRYQTWTNTVLNAGLYPEIWGATLMAFKVVQETDNTSLLTYSVAGSNGTITANVDGVNVASNSYIQNGKNVIFTANPAAGYRVKNWKLNNVIVTGNTTNTYVLSNIQQASDVKVEFEQISYLVSYSVVGTNGSLAGSVNGVTFASNSNVPQGSNVIFVATPSSGYQVKEWKLNNVIVSGNTSNSFAISNLQEVSNVTVEFKLISTTSYAVTYSVVNGNGSLSAAANSANVPSGTMVLEGTDVIFTAIPSSGYRVKQWKFNDVIASGNTSNNYILSVQQSSNVVVEFELIPANSYVVTFSVVNANGTLSAMVDGVAFSSGYAVEQGKNVIFTAVPAIGYKVKEWKLNSNIVSGNITNTFTASNIQQAINVTVEYELDDIQVTYSVVGSNGTLSASVDGIAINSGAMVSPNKTVVFTASPNAGYQVKQWKLNNVIVSGNTSNTFVIQTLQQTSNVTVEFEAIASSTYSVVYYVVGGNGNLTASVDGVQIASGTNVQANKSVIFTATPNSDYIVKEWVLNSNIVAGHTSTIYAISSLQEVSVVTVEFKSDNVGINDNENTNINIYPNPSTGIFNIQSDNQYTMEVMDIQGRLIIRQQIEIGLNELDMSIHQAGVYFVKLSNKEGVKVLKINKIKK